MTQRAFNVLFLCTGNSARSIMAEAVLNKWGAGKFHAYSAGSHPKGFVQPMAWTLLNSLGLPVEGLRSKSWDEFAAADAPEMDFIFTLCDQAAGETCPAWPGRPITAHWGMSDPAAIDGSEVIRMQAYREALRALENRIKIFTVLPFASLDRMALAQRAGAIGLLNTDSATETP
ncbi:MULTISPECIES: arsenate reductase ArsC [unclassified Acidocella]|uniref:arsenate reductase ArsC n=1 Tax=unclassified Acidocella TaxID=2648610 RepID=UPI00028C3FC2|nr:MULTISPECIES: arsenate reductase ArsC [unclassified Acidocella]EKM98157.1 arsenate reductase [Acidocella sp. MX-AZ02]WBO59401.1 arsenate reductase ArsC [Acidocella sp. MX-AZ03]